MIAPRQKHIDPVVTGLLELLDVRVVEGTDAQLNIRMYRRTCHCDAIIERDAAPEIWRQVLATMIEQLNIAEKGSSV